MAQVNGHVCDACDLFVRLPIDAPADHLPARWIIVILPGTDADVREHNKIRQFCSGACHALFAIERAEAEAATSAIPQAESPQAA